MLRRIMVDQILCEDENISINAAIIFDVIIKLSSHSQIAKTVLTGYEYAQYNGFMGSEDEFESTATPKDLEDKVFTVLYRNMLLLQVKYFKISKVTLSKALNELEEAKLIECINKNTTPAYRTTPKADKYNFLPKDGEFNTSANKPQKNKKQLLSLGKVTRLEDTTADYKKILQEKAKEHTEDVNKKHPNIDIDFVDNYQSFINHHISKGTKMVNWLSAYRTWCKNTVKYAQPNGGENSNGGLYG